MTELALETLLEATLFGSGKSMSVSELSESLGYEDDEIIDSLGALQATMKRRRGGALRLVEIGGKWAMEVRSPSSDAVFLLLHGLFQLSLVIVRHEALSQF